MNTIVCPIRGGKASRATISSAIGLAKKTSSQVIFVYVVNQELIRQARKAQAVMVTEQIRQMGQSVLLTAQALANSQGVMAQGMVRHGNVVDQIAQTCRELNAEYLVLDSAGTGTGQARSRPLELGQLVEQIEKKGDTRIVLAQQEMVETR